MSENGALPKIVIGLTALFVVGAIVQLLSLQFSSGSAYPPYSSMRSEPLGTKVLHNSLDRMGEINVERNFRPLADLADSGKTDGVVVVAGMPYFLPRLNPAAMNDLMTYVHRGGTVVIAFAPDMFGAASPIEDKAKADVNGDGDTTAAETEQTEEEKEDLKRREEEIRRTFLKDQATNANKGKRQSFDFDDFALAVHYRRNELDQAVPDAVRAKDADKDLPAQLAWRADRYLEVSDAWQVQYTIYDKPAVVSRKFGLGRVICSADSYWLTNAAMKKDRATAAVGWMVADNSRVIFDEFLKGMHRKTNAMSLVYAYRLHGFFAGVLVIALLYLWYATSSFLPPLTEGEAITHHDSAHDAATGLANLLQRHVSARELLQTCLRHWQAAHKGDAVTDEKLARMGQLANDPLPRTNADEALIERYKEMCTLTERGGR